MPQPKQGSVYETAQGRWRGLLHHFGLTEKQVSGKHTSCPIPGCGGKDRFRVKEFGKGIWYCTHCGSGVGIDLLMKVKGWSFKEAAQAVEAVCGVYPQESARPERTEAEKCESLRAIWQSATPMQVGDAGWQYLIRRGLNLKEPPQEVRVHPGMDYRDESGKVIGRYPAILQRVTGPDGKGMTIHRTYVLDGQKAPVENPKKIMPGKPRLGGAVRVMTISEGTDTQATVGVAEGLETALAAMLLFGIPVWPCLDTAGLESFEPPEGVRRVVICGDNDLNFAGQKAAYTLAYRLATKGYEVEVEIPLVPGEDWLDYHIRTNQQAGKPVHLEAA